MLEFNIDVNTTGVLVAVTTTQYHIIKSNVHPTPVIMVNTNLFDIHGSEVRGEFEITQAAMDRWVQQGHYTYPIEMICKVLSNGYIVIERVCFPNSDPVLGYMNKQITQPWYMNTQITQL